MVKKQMEAKEMQMLLDIATHFHLVNILPAKILKETKSINDSSSKNIFHALLNHTSRLFWFILFFFVITKATFTNNSIFCFSAL